MKNNRYKPSRRLRAAIVMMKARVIEGVPTSDEFVRRYKELMQPRLTSAQRRHGVAPN
jgi:hypothetical protein